MDNKQVILLNGWGLISPITEPNEAKKISCRKVWTDFELGVLKENWPDLERLKQILPTRSDQSIRQKAIAIGLSNRGTKHWAPSEIQLLEDVYPRSGIDQCLLQLPGRTRASIRNQVKSMGLRRVKQ